MLACWIRWIGIVVAAALIVGCNSFAPAIAAASGPVVAMPMPGGGRCHSSDDKGRPATPVCKAACLAIPATAPLVAAALAPPSLLNPAPLPVLQSRSRTPDTPPPRDA